MMRHFPFLLLRTPVQGLRQAYAFAGKMEPIIEEGLYLASPEFWSEYSKIQSCHAKDAEKIGLSLAKYWIRSCTRCTPYGTFAGSALLAVVPDETSIVLKKRHEHRRFLRLDMNYISAMIQALVQLPAIRSQIKFFSNNTLYELPDGYRYVDYSMNQNGRSYGLSSIEKSDYLQAILDAAAAGATLDELAEILTSFGSEDPEEGLAFVRSLWESQLLVAGLEPSVTGREPMDQVIDKLSTLQGVDDLVTRLKKIRSLLQFPEEGVPHYEQIEAYLKNLGPEIQMPRNTLQTDLFLSLDQKTINKDLVEGIIGQAGDLVLLSRPIINQDLKTFREKFAARYEDSEVPLVVAMDSEIGIGYAGSTDASIGGGKMVNDLAVGGKASSELKESDPIYAYVVSKYDDYLKNGKGSIEITAEELNQFKDLSATHRFPGSMYLLGHLLKKEGLLSPENFLFDLTSFYGPSAANLLGRFIHGDEEIGKLTKAILQEEEKENPGFLYAEVVHLPESRIGNVLLRPILREYEIPYAGISGAPAEKQIAVDDLLVSVRNGEVILRSLKRQKRIIPRLTTAHNYTFNCLPMYKFLCDLQLQGLAYPSAWDWGPLAGLPHLPRVVYKNIILQKAQWRLGERMLKGLPAPGAARDAYLSRLRLERKMPPTVVLKEGDNKLLVDFEEKTGIDLLLYYWNRNKMVVLEEFLFTEENCIVRDVDGAAYTDEMVIPIFRESNALILDQTADSSVQSRDPGDVASRGLEEMSRAGRPLKRKFSPHSEWLYFKVYAGPKTAEKILKTILFDFVEEGVLRNYFERFFFIRYRDEFSHLRIRFYNADISKQALVYRLFMEALQPLLDAGSVDKIIVDTYARELERYGESIIGEAEALFFHDSLTVLRFIRLLEGEEGEDYRLLFALRGIDLLLDDFQFSFAEKKTLAKNLQSGYFTEFGGPLSLQRQLNEKYRILQQAIFSHLNPEKDGSNEIEEAVAIFRERSKMNAPIVQTIFSKLAGTAGRARMIEMLHSFIHMYMNRLFIGSQRKYELLVYHFLEKYYTSQGAITKRQNQINLPEDGIR